MDKSILEKFASKFPFLFDKWRSNVKYPFSPLIISSCNGNGKVNFSNASLNVGYDITTDPGLAELFLYRGGYYDIKIVKQTSALRSLQRLYQFLCDAGEHFKCIELLMKTSAYPIMYKDLLSVKDAKGNIITRKISECDVQTIMAVHLLEPLVLNVKIKATAGYKPECRFCSKKVATGDTSLGNHRVWHGQADILLEQSLAKVEMKGVDDEMLNPDENQVETSDGIGEPRGTQPSTSKQPRLDSYGDDEAVEDEEEKITNDIECEFSTETYMPYGPQKLTHTQSTDKNLSQVLAQTIVNAFLQTKLKPELKNSFIPAFLISDSYITIHMYNVGLDVLLTQSDAMSIFENDGKLNTDTMLSLWLALNIHNFTKTLPNEPVDNPILSSIPKSNFQTFMHKASVFGIYENEMNMPLGPRPLRVREQKRPSDDKSADYAKKYLQALDPDEPETQSDQSVIN